jgi:hypothetical protein
VGGSYRGRPRRKLNIQREKENAKKKNTKATIKKENDNYVSKTSFLSSY